MATIVIIDSDDLAAMLMKKTLELNGHHSILFKQGTAALQDYGNHHADLYIVELSLPDCSSVEMIDSLRQISQAVPIIAVSSRTDINEEYEALQAGAMTVINKPFMPRSLLTQIESYLNA